MQSNLVPVCRSCLPTSQSGNKPTFGLHDVGFSAAGRLTPKLAIARSLVQIRDLVNFCSLWLLILLSPENGMLAC